VHKYVYFNCRRCTSRLRAQAALAGAKRRCPRCQLVQEVPAQSRAARPGEQYEVWEGDGPAPPGAPQVAAGCPVCGSRVVAAVDQVGRRVACPDCGTPVVMPAPEPPGAPPKAERAGAQDDPTDTGYLLYEEAEEVGAGEDPAERIYIPVHCPLCNTLMQATEDQVGQKVVCPDCGTPTTVPAPKRAARPGAGTRTHEAYAVFEEVGPAPAESRVVYGAYVKVHCTVCRALLHFTEDQVGRQVRCPDCGTRLEIPRRPDPRKPPKSRRRIGQRQESPYRVDQGSEPPGYRRVVAASAERWAFVETRRRERAPGPPPRRPLLSGVFGFPAARAARTWWLWLSLLLALAVFLFVRGMTMVGEPVGGVGNLPIWIIALITSSLGVMALLVWLPVASAFAVAVIHGAASGDDTLEELTEAPFLDWVLDGLFVINSLALSTGVTYGAARLMGAEQGVVRWVCGGGLLLLFPVVLLSMLETGSPLRPFSPPVWRSLIANGLVWLAFLVESALLWGAVAAWTASLVTGIPAALEIVLAALLGMYAMIVYCRMLGRLAWCCAAGGRCGPGANG